MAEYISKDTEKAIVKLVNELTYDDELLIDTDNYKRIDFRIYNHDILKLIVKKLKCKDIGNIFKYPEDIPQPDTLNGYDIINDFDKYQRINISKKYKAIILYSSLKYSSPLSILTNINNIKKILKLIKPIIDSDEYIDIFKDIDFKCKKNEYIDITYKGEQRDPDDNTINAIKRTIDKENLVFDTGSELFNVMSDIHTFFEDETKELYKKMDIVYKRGIIIHGKPGNGKSSLIREIIRQLTDINKIVINTNNIYITKVLSSLITKLNNQKSIIIIEDIDSLITNGNRSEFLNLLDGISIKSGLYFIGSTNYPERIDPAFINRSGRFDRTYEIGNPSDRVREVYFKSKNIPSLLSSFKIHKENSENKDLGIIDLFVKYTDDFSMANLKEFMISVQYMLAAKKVNSIEDAVIEVNKILTNVIKREDNNNDDFDSRLNDVRPRYGRYMY